MQQKRNCRLETSIRSVTFAAQDIIEMNVVRQIRGENISTQLCEGIQMVLEHFVSIEMDLMKIKDKKVKEDRQPTAQRSTTASSSRPLPSGKITMVGFDKHLIEIMDALATNEFNRQIIPIMGMGGIGKTTLATAVFNNPFIVQHFHVRAWVTISQEYIVRELLLRLLYHINAASPYEQERSGDLEKFIAGMSEKSDEELGLQLHKGLFDRKYLIVLDDVWNVQVWEKLKIFLPDNKNGSRILVTTRLSNLAVDFGSCSPHQIGLLDQEKSWDLLRGKVFGKEDCPDELEEIGKDIAKKCAGLPLALVVIGGLLAESERTMEYWESIAGDVTLALNYESDEHFKKILSLSYIHLPLYLKPCYLYMAVFPEDSEIRVSTLIKLWVAEGFIKLTQAKCLEEVAHEYLEDLISRNLIMVHRRGCSRKVRYCKIHDLLRNLCIIQAREEKFVYIAKLDDLNISPVMEIERRLSVYSPSGAVETTTIEALRSAIFNRSWSCHDKSFRYKAEHSKQWMMGDIIHHVSWLLNVVHGEPLVNIFGLINLRYVVAWSVTNISSISLCWNLQTLVVDVDITLPVEIWQMPQLRHLTGITLPDPPDDQNVIVLENLQTLKRIRNFKCTDQVSKRIPNLKKLDVYYIFDSSENEQAGNYCLKDLVCFKNLASLCIRDAAKLRTEIAFPISLKKLTLRNCKIPWEEFSIVGKLPNLEVLQLFPYATEGEEWNPNEGEFCRLKFLMILSSDLKLWGAENYHFPCLEYLVLGRGYLEEIPMSFAEILTLQSMDLLEVNDSVIASAREISEQRELLGYERLNLRWFKPDGKDRIIFGTSY